MARSRHIRPPAGGPDGLGRDGGDGTPFERLVAILTDRRAGADPSSALRRLGGAWAVDRLFRAALLAAVRRGPGSVREGWGPVRLIEIAGQGAEVGAVPAATAPALRGTLRDLEERLLGERLWRPGAPVWWQPLPEARTPEQVWTALERTLRPGGSLPAADELAGALTSPAGPGWSVIPGALAPELLDRMHRELAGLARGQVLELVRGGVGAEDRASPARSDRVAYVTGLEPELLAAAPSVATLAQWLLHGLARRVAASLPGALHPPVSAMLARYATPCRGFAPHLDNPGGEQDNARAVTAVAYLNAPGAPCVGGELSLWGPGRPGRTGARRVVSPAGGTLALFDARRVVHEVLPLQPGPDRWTMVVWLSDASRPVPRLPEPPKPTPADVLEPLGDEVPVPEGRVLVRTLPAAGLDPGGAVGPEGGDLGRGSEVRSVALPGSGADRPRAGIVCTTERPGPRLDAWCRHHLALGFDRLVVVLDPGVPASAVAIDGAEERVTIWTHEEAAGRWAETLDGAVGRSTAAAALLDVAGRGRATHAVAARQTLNATAALVAARRGELGRDGLGASGAPLDWLLHLDDDELFFVEGAARGGASLGEHFAALDALRREEPGRYDAVRYPNHELLLTRDGSGPVRFKRNPRLAADHLGSVGWRRVIRTLGMEQDGGRPYFRAYWNGKSAVAVARGRAAAGVHGWWLDDPAGGAGEPGAGALVDGPSILHLHLPTAEAFRSKYLGVATTDPAACGGRPFPPSPLEERAVGLIRALRSEAAGASDEEIAARLDRLYADTLCFGTDEVELLDAAGLLFTVELDLGPWTGSSGSR